MSKSAAGYLYKQTGVLKTWKRFYCTLGDNTLKEYTDKDGTELSNTNIDKSTSFKILTETNRPYCFEITLKGKPFVYRAEDEESFSKWINAFTYLINKFKQAPGSKPKVSLDDFQILKVIGRGYYGKVFLVRLKSTGQLYALKAMNKAKLAEDNTIKQILIERDILFQNEHPFLVRGYYTFQTEAKVFIVLAYVPGGELFRRLKEEGKFTERRTQLYAAELVLALSHLHQHGILYRDLKPENILVDVDGHLKITDFGFSKPNIVNEGQTTTTFCGTPEYLAPEVFRQQPYSRSVDWWSLGIILFEMLSGYQPFFDTNIRNMCRSILYDEIEFPPFFSPNAVDLISKLLEKDPKKRIGSGPTDAEEIKSHNFFIGINWDNVYNKKTKPRWIPTIENEIDTSNFDEEFTEQPTAVSFEDPSLVPEEAQIAFQGFTFNSEEKSVI
ncbi:AGC family protein kinase [Histomonas meleagridis]|uniref:AGC family protein kinase n=1 Tax=Histomonas meleagridis TaxID=135588 RepID=UPI0035599867|nr:AGC family protein kinase [Histomonas meleagridis]KAH0802739.1 AGC family protein kinase [Histomonas meleagridis]